MSPCGAGPVFQDVGIDPALFHRPHGIHGVAHTRRVLTHAFRIADAVGALSRQRDALRLAALWHDIGRTHDGVDSLHGAHSCAKVLELDLHAGLDPHTARVTLFAIEHHCTDDRDVPAAAKPVFGKAAAEDALHVWRLLKDADGLDRVRLGLGPAGVEPAQLRFPFSRDQLRYAWDLYWADTLEEATP